MNHFRSLGGDAPTSIPNQNAWDVAVTTAGKEVVGGNFDLKKIGIGTAIAVGAAVAQSVIPIPLVGAAIGAIIGAIAGMIGVRGGTQHMAYDDALQFARSVAEPFRVMYVKLPQDGKDFVLARAMAFMDNMSATYHGWWANSVQLYPNYPLKSGEGPMDYYIRAAKEGVGPNSLPGSGGEGRVVVAIYLPIFIMMTKSDLDGVQDSFANQVKPIINNLLTQPIQTLVETRFKQLVESNQTGVIDTPNPAAASFGSGVGILLLAGLGIGAMMMVGKRR